MQPNQWLKTTTQILGVLSGYKVIYRCKLDVTRWIIDISRSRHKVDLRYQVDHTWKSPFSHGIQGSNSSGFWKLPSLQTGLYLFGCGKTNDDDANLSGSTIEGRRTDCKSRTCWKTCKTTNAKVMKFHQKWWLMSWKLLALLRYQAKRSGSGKLTIILCPWLKRCAQQLLRAQQLLGAQQL